MEDYQMDACQVREDGRRGGGGEEGREGEDRSTVLLLSSLLPIDIDSKFKQHLGELAPFLLAPDKLVIKKVNGAPLTGKMLYDIFGVSFGITVVLEDGTSCYSSFLPRST